MNKILLFIIISISTLFATTTKKDLYLTQFPFTALKSDSLVSFSWVPILNNLNIPIDSLATFHFSKTPGGNDIKNYSNSFTGTEYFSYSSDNQPIFSFIPANIKDDNNNQIMNVGVFYYVISISNISGSDTTIYVSNQLQLIVESKSPVVPLYPVTSSTDGITETVPVFSWESNPGVPYYHLILSDEPIQIDQDAKSVSGISAIWQVITPNTSIQYGTPDPSGQFSDIAPPPLSPGTVYNWLVLNNYGNTVYSSSTVAGAPVSFSIKGTNNITTPINLYPNNNDSLNSSTDSTITFKWKSGGKNVNSYELYIFVNDSINGVEAKVNIWKGTTTDTFYVFNAKKTLYDKRYYWKVYALNSEGVGKVSDFTSFKYKIDVAYLTTHTYTTINGQKESLPYVSIQAVPITGSADIIPFGTDKNGNGATRPFLPGKYKLIASKDKYIQTETIVDMSKSDTTYIANITMDLAPATAYGKVIDKNQNGVGEVTINATGPNNSSVTTKTDNNGNYTLDITTEGLWTINASKTGYESALPVSFNIENGEAKKIDDISIKKASYQIFGKVINSESQPIKRVLVEVINNQNNLTYDFTNTADDGSFNFFVPYGEWTIKASLDGFATQEKNITNLASSNEVNITLKEAGQISGTIYRTDYIIENNTYGSPSQYNNATVYAINQTTNDTITTTTDAFGKYSFGINYGNYKIFATAKNFINGQYSKIVTVSPTSRTATSIDIVITSYGDIKGTIYQKSDSSTLSSATLNLKDSLNNIIATTTSNSDGTFLLEDIKDGTYKLYCAKLGYKSATPINITIDSGKVNVRPIFYIEKGEIYRLNITTLFNNKILTSPFITLTEPIYKTIKSNSGQFQIDSLVAETYKINISSNIDSILDCKQSYTIIDNPLDSIKNDSINFSITHHNRDTLYFNSDGATISINATVLKSSSYSAKIYYKTENQSNYQSKNLSLVGNKFTTNINLDNGDVYLYYYFQITDNKNSITYTNIDRPYYSYIYPIVKMEYIAFSPTLPDTTSTKLFLKDMQYPISINAYYHGIIYENLINEVIWKSSDSSIISFEKNITTNTEINKIYCLKQSTKPVLIKAIGIGNLGEKDTIYAKVEVVEGKIDSIYIKREDIKVDNFSITNDQVGIFKTYGLVNINDSTTKTMELPAIWELSPSTAATFDNNKLNINSDFIGQLKITASITNFGSVTYNDNSAIRYKNRYLHVKSLITPPDTVSDYKALKIIINDSSLINAKNDEISLANEVVTNSQKTVNKYELMGDIYNLSMKNSNVFNKPLNFIYKVSNNFIDRKKFALGLYNDSLLSFELIDTNLSLKKDSTLTADIKHFSTYAFFATREPLKIKDVHLTPNPFSPFVYARDNDKKYPGIGIKFYCSSQYDPVPSIKIEIRTLKGVKVWERKDSPAPVSGYQEFHWDGKYLNTNDYVRNGRYIITITAHELSTGTTDEYKDIIVLIK